eukprot:gene7033-20517_t
MAAQLFETMNAQLQTPQGKEAAKKVNEIIMYEFGDTGAKYVIDLKAGKVYKGEAEAACTFKMDEPVFLQLVGGKADPMQLFMEGKMELDGDTDVAMKLGKVLKALKANGAGGTASLPAAAAPPLSRDAPARGGAPPPRGGVRQRVRLPPFLSVACGAVAAEAPPRGGDAPIAESCEWPNRRRR